VFGLRVLEQLASIATPRKRSTPSAMAIPVGESNVTALSSHFDSGTKPGVSEPAVGLLRRECGLRHLSINGSWPNARSASADLGI
jgi:hypothetical protein